MPPDATALALIFTLLMPLAGIGLALINAGLTRSRNAAHTLLAALCALAVAALAYFVFGFAWQSFPGGPSYVVALGSREWNWLGAQPFFFRGLDANSPRAAVTAIFGLFAAGLAALIPLAAAAERLRLAAVCASTAVLAGWIFPLFAHFTWGGGWLAQLGAFYGLGRGLVDTGGAGTVHVLGGLSAVSLAWLMGPRRGKYSLEGMPAAIPGHNAAFVLIGCIFAWAGLLGLNSAAAILFSGANTGTCALIAINTSLAAGGALLTAAAFTRTRFGKPDASLCANGWVGGLAGISAACADAKPAQAVLIGLISGLLVTFAVEVFEFRLQVDDPGGAVSVHGVSGLWGLVAAAWFVPGQQQWVAQAAGIATLLGCILPVSYGLNWLLNLLFPYRVPPEAERQGLDLHELGAGAYPDFMTHSEDFPPR